VTFKTSKGTIWAPFHYKSKSDFTRGENPYL